MPARSYLVETSLYLPVKRHLERLGFIVKGEICGCDVVAISEDGPATVVVGELKMQFNLDLVLQAVERTTVCDEVWVAVPASKRGRGREADPRVKRLCRMLGLGLLCVFASGKVEVLVEPGPWRPRANAQKRSRIVSEHRRRQGDPVTGGSTRLPQMTAYRQQALTCAVALAEGPARPRDLKAIAPDVAKILRRNVYGWFERKERGIYAITAAGREALTRWREHLPELAPSKPHAPTPGPSPQGGGGLGRTSVEPGKPRRRRKARQSATPPSPQQP